MSVLSTPSAFVGIDVAKVKLDVVLLQEQQRAVYRVFANSEAGFFELHAWLCSAHLLSGRTHICLEATGSYSDALCLHLFEKGYLISVLNPAVLVAYRRSQQVRSKTDKLAAHLLARYAQERRPRLFHPLPEAIGPLRALLHRRDDLLGMMRMERNRLHAGRMTQSISERVGAHLAFLLHELRSTEREIRAFLAANAHLHAIWVRLQSIPGIGWLTAAHLLAHIGEIERFEKVGSLVSLAGLAVKEQVSGSSVYARPQIDRHGRKDLRSSLYMSALVARRVSPEIREWANSKTGKPKKVILVALMRKLVHIVYGVWKSGLPYQPALAFPNAL